jgi:transposase
MPFRGELTNDQWARLAPLLAATKPMGGRPSTDDRRVLNGILWKLRTGAPWRGLPERYGPWSTVRTRLRAALGGAAGVRRFREHLERVQHELASLGHAAAPRLVIHGDPTTGNVVVDGAPPAVVGLIDFGAAYHEAPLADVGFGLWRSGRPEPGAVAVDPARVHRLVAGYHGVRPLDARAGPAAICAYMRARGLQFIVHNLGGGDLSLALRRVEALAAGQPAPEAAIAVALSA